MRSCRRDRPCIYRSTGNRIIMKECEQQDELDDQDDHPAAGSESSIVSQWHKILLMVDERHIRTALSTFEMAVARDDMQSISSALDRPIASAIGSAYFRLRSAASRAMLL